MAARLRSLFRPLVPPSAMSRRSIPILQAQLPQMSARTVLNRSKFTLPNFSYMQEPGPCQALHRLIGILNHKLEKHSSFNRPDPANEIEERSKHDPLTSLSDRGHNEGPKASTRAAHNLLWRAKWRHITESVLADSAEHIASDGELFAPPCSTLEVQFAEWPREDGFCCPCLLDDGLRAIWISREKNTIVNEYSSIGGGGDWEEWEEWEHKETVGEDDETKGYTVEKFAEFRREARKMGAGLTGRRLLEELGAALNGVEEGESEGGDGMKGRPYLVGNEDDRPVVDHLNAMITGNHNIIGGYFAMVRGYREYSGRG